MTDHITFRPGQDPAVPLHRAQNDFDAVKAELDHTHRLATLGLMAAGVAHEINNILTPVLAYAQLAQSSPDDRALAAKALEKAIRGVENATKIAQAMLGFAGAEHESQSTNISQAVESALECMGRDPAKDRIRLVTNIPSGCCASIRPLALQQVLINIMLNACTAMRKRGGDLTLAAVDTADGSTQITISDTGPGIPDDVVGRLFRPFATATAAHATRAARSSTGVLEQSRGGSGLGLSICRRLIEDSGGSIAIRTTPGEGTTVTITLPTGKSALAKAV